MKFSQLAVPVIGNNRQFIENHRIMVRANQKLGMACPMTATVSAKRSIMELGRIAANTPSGIERIKAKARAQAPNSIVVGRRSKTTEATSDFR